MRKAANEDAVIPAERQVLRALCQGTPQGSVREIAKHILKDYRWRGPLNDVLFETLASLETDSPEVLRAQLPAVLTRRGFPDVPWEDFFAPHRLTKEDSEKLMRRLRQL